MATRLRIATSGKAANADDIGGAGVAGDYLRRVASATPSQPDDVEWSGTQSELLALTKYPTGFVNRTDSTLAFSDATRTFTVGPTGASYTVWYHGQKLLKSAPESVVWPNVEGLQAAYFDSSGTIQTTNNPNTIANVFGGDGIPIAAWYWDATNAQTIRRIEERHDTSLPPAMHIYLHRYVGTVLEGAGGALGNFVAGGTGNDANNAEFSVADCTVADEDIRWPIINAAPQVLSPIAQIPMYSLTGPGTGIWRQKTADNFPLIYSGTGGYVGANGRLPWNQFIAGAWQLTEVTQLDFVLGHYFASTDLRLPIFGIVGQAVYTTATLARAGANVELNNIQNLNSLLSTEKRALGSVIFQTSAAYGNVPKARVVVTDTGRNYVDWRATSIYTGVILV